MGWLDDVVDEPLTAEELASVQSGDLESYIKSRPAQALADESLPSGYRLAAAVQEELKIRTPETAGPRMIREAIKYAPFARSVVGGLEQRDYGNALKAIGSGKGTVQDYRTASRALVEGDEAQKKTVLRQIGEGIGVLPAFLTELWVTAGAAKAGQFLGEAGAAAAGAGKVGQAAAGFAGAAALQSAANPQMILESAAQAQVPEVAKIGDGEAAALAVQDIGPGPIKALLQGYGDTIAEVGSERAGEVIAPALGKLGKQIAPELAARFGKYWLRFKATYPGASTDQFLQHIQDPATEFLEERIADVAHGTIGSAQDFGLTGKVATGDLDEEAARQAAVEAGVLIPAGGLAAAARAPLIPRQVARTQEAAQRLLNRQAAQPAPSAAPPVSDTMSETPPGQGGVEQRATDQPRVVPQQQVLPPIEIGAETAPTPILGPQDTPAALDPTQMSDSDLGARLAQIEQDLEALDDLSDPRYDRLAIEEQLVKAEIAKRTGQAVLNQVGQERQQFPESAGIPIQESDKKQETGQVTGTKIEARRPLPEAPKPLRAGAGWKLHLAVSPENAAQVRSSLLGYGYTFKIGKSGGQEGKDFTVYLGHKDKAIAAAKSISIRLADLLGDPHGDALRDDTLLAPRVMGRFDPHGDDEFHQYGESGVPWLKEDMDPWNRKPGAASRADKRLREKYGDFYTGSEVSDAGEVRGPEAAIQAARDVEPAGQEAGRDDLQRPAEAGRAAGDEEAQERGVLAGRLYRETSLDELEEYLPGGTLDGGHNFAPTLFFSDNPDLALGQGKNKGVVMEFDASQVRDITGQKPREHAKPGTAVPGVGKEWKVMQRPGALKKALTAFTIKKGAEVGKPIRIRLNRFFEQTLKWDKQELPDGSIRYTKPQAGVRSERGGAKTDTGFDVLPGGAAAPTDQPRGGAAEGLAAERTGQTSGADQEGAARKVAIHAAVAKSKSQSTDRVLRQKYGDAAVDLATERGWVTGPSPKDGFVGITQSGRKEVGPLVDKTGNFIGLAHQILVEQISGIGPTEQTPESVAATLSARLKSGSVRLIGPDGKTTTVTAMPSKGVVRTKSGQKIPLEDIASGKWRIEEPAIETEKPVSGDAAPRQPETVVQAEPTTVSVGKPAKVGKSGQTAIPGLEEEAQIGNARDEEDARWDKYVQRIRAEVDERTADQVREQLRGLSRKVAARIADDISASAHDLSEEMLDTVEVSKSGSPSLDEQREKSVGEALDEATDEAFLAEAQSLQSAGDWEIGDRVEVEPGNRKREAILGTVSGFTVDYGQVAALVKTDGGDTDIRDLDKLRRYEPEEEIAPGVKPGAGISPATAKAVVESVEKQRAEAKKPIAEQRRTASTIPDIKTASLKEARDFAAAQGINTSRRRGSIAHWIKLGREALEAKSQQPKSQFSGPTLEQYDDIKAQMGSAIILFRMGDFYEAFKDDAKTISKVLGLALTTRDKGDDSVPMSGFPYHQLESYLGKLVAAGHRVAVAEQVDPHNKPLDREVERVVSPPEKLVGENLTAEQEASEKPKKPRKGKSSTTGEPTQAYAPSDTMSEPFLERTYEFAAEPSRPLAGVTAASVPLNLSAGPPSPRLVSASDIVATLQREFGTTLQYGRVPNRTAGNYAIWSEIARVSNAEMASLATETHEIAHDVDKKTEVLTEAIGDRKRPHWRRLIQRAQRQHSRIVKTGKGQKWLEKWAEQLTEAGAPQAVADSVRAADFAQAEAGIDQVLGPQTPEQFVREKELAALDYKPLDRLDEGFAEWARGYLTRDDVAQKAPRFTSWMLEDWLPKHPKYRQAFLHAKALIDAYRAQTPLERAQQNRAKPGDKPKPLDVPLAEAAGDLFGGAAGQAMTDWIDPYHFFELIDKEIAAKGGVTEQNDNTVVELVRFMDGGTINHVNNALLGDGIFTVSRGHSQRLFGSLKDVFEELRQAGYKEEEWDSYHVARHIVRDVLPPLAAINAQRAAKGKEPIHYNAKMREEDARAILDQIESDQKKRDIFERTSQQFVKFREALLDLRAEAGLITPALAKKLKDLYPHFASMQGVRPGSLYGRLFGRSALNVQSGLRRRSLGGSGHPILYQVDALRADLLQAYHAVLVNTTKRGILERVVKAPALGLNGLEGLGHIASIEQPHLKRTEFPIDNILGQLVEKGVVSEEQATLYRAVDRLRNGEASKKDIEFLAGQYGTDAEDELLELTKDIPDLLETLAIYRPAYKASSGEFIEVMLLQGQPRLVRWSPQIYETLERMGPLQLNFFERMLAGTADWQRLGQTGLHTRFAISQVPADVLTGIIQGREASVAGSVTGPIHALGKIAGAIAADVSGSRKSPLMELVAETYGSLFEEMPPDALGAKQLRLALFSEGLAAKALEVIKQPSLWGRSLRIGAREVGSALAYLDLPARIPEGMAVLKRFGYIEKRDPGGKLRWYNEQKETFENPTIEVKRKFMAAIADATVPYRRTGFKTRYFNRVWTPYLGPFVSATRMVAQSLNEARLGNRKAQGRVFVGLAIGTVMAFLMRAIGGDDKEEESAYTTVKYWQFAPGLAIRKPQSWTWLMSLPQAMLALALDDDGMEQAKDLATEELKQFSYVSLPGLDKDPLLGNAAKISAIGPLAEVAANRKAYQERPIESPHMQDWPAAERYDARTSAAAVGVGQVTGPALGIGPKKVEYLTERLSGGLLTRNPLENPLRGHEPFASVREFEERLTALQAQRESLGRHLPALTNGEYEALPPSEQIGREAYARRKAGWTDAQEREYDRLAAADRLSRGLFTLTKQGKLTEDLQSQYRTSLARRVLGKEPLESYADLHRDYAKLPKELQELIDAELASAARKVLANKPVSVADKEKAGGLTLAAKRAAWSQERAAARRELEASPVGQEAALRAVRSWIRGDLKERKAEDEKIERFKRLMGWSS